MEQMSNNRLHISLPKLQINLMLFLSAFLIQSTALNAQISDFNSWIQKNRITNELTFPRFQKNSAPLSIDENAARKKLQEGQKEKNSIKTMSAAQAIGMSLLMKNQPQNALPYFSQAIEVVVQNKDIKSEIEIFAQIGLAYRLLNQNEKALDYYKKAHQKNISKTSRETEDYLLSQLAQVSFELNDLKSAEEYFSRVSKSFAAQKKTTLAAISLNSLGELQLRNNDYNKATESFKSALNRATASNENILNGIIYRNLGLVYFKRGKFELALEEFNKSLTFDNQLLVHQLTKDACMQLFTLFSYQNNFEKGDAFHEKYIGIKESLGKRSKAKWSDFENKWQAREKELVIDLLKKQDHNSTPADGEQQLELSQLITKSDLELNQKDEALEEKTAEVEQLTKEKALQQRDMARQELQLAKQKHFKNLLMGLSIAALAFLAFLYNRYLFKKKSNLKLQASNIELENTLKQLRETQDQLLQSEKMASLGLLTAGIAHEIQNPLNFVVNFSEGTLDILSELLEAKSEQEKTELAKELNESLKKIHHHGKRAERIVKGMLQYSREGSGGKELAEINQLLFESVNLAYHGVRATHKDFQCVINEQFETQLTPLYVIPQDLSRVFLNIANNAFYALREKTGANPAFKSELKITTGLKGDRVEIRIKDNGTGIPKEKADKIFQPFFTTKPSGQGTGLGLSMSYDIITKLHQGNIEIHSIENEYTEFIIQLPITTH